MIQSAMLECNNDTLLAAISVIVLDQCLVDENDKIRRDVCGCTELNPAEPQVQDWF